MAPDSDMAPGGDMAPDGDEEGRGMQEKPAGRMDEESKFPRGAAIRIFAYLVAGHLVAAFLFLLFEVAPK